MSVLSFPDEVRRFRDLRRWARLEFQQDIRASAISEFGSEAADMGVLVFACRRCGQATSTLHTFPDLSDHLSHVELESMLRRLWGPEREGWHSAFCSGCEASGDLLMPVVGHFGRYLAASRTDLQLELTFGHDRVLRVDYLRMAADGMSHRQVPRPRGELEILETFGAPLSLRALWPEFIEAHLEDRNFATIELQPGFILGLRPYTTDHREALGFYEGFERWLEALRRERPYDTVTFLRDREDDGIPIPVEESYHAWMPQHATDVTEALIDPFIVADSDTFLRVFDEVASRRGVRVQRDSDESTLFARLTSGEISARLNLGPRYFRLLHTGLPFYRGSMQLFGSEILALEAAGHLPALLRERLPGYRVAVRNGLLLEVADRYGNIVLLEDVVRVATTHDLDSEAGWMAFVARLQAGGVHEHV